MSEFLVSPGLMANVVRNSIVNVGETVLHCIALHCIALHCIALHTVKVSKAKSGMFAHCAA
jgi:hypothetical protein